MIGGAATCAHELCRCRRPYSPQTLAMSTRRVDPYATYCSDRCEQMAEHPTTAGGCECGHPDCTPQATPDIPPMQ
jgi:hypothetical protein